MNDLDFREMVETLPHLVWSARPDGTTDYYNARCLEYFGLSREQVRGETWVEMLHPDDRQRSIAAWTAACANGTEYRIEYRLRRGADGQYRWHDGSAFPIRDAAGTIVRWVGTCTDIEERKSIEEGLKQTNDRLQLALRAAGAGVWELDVTSGRAYWSPQLYQLFGLDPQTTEASYDNWQKLLHPADREVTVARIQRSFREGIELRYEYRIIRPDGQVRWLKVLGQSYKVEGRTARMLGITIDNTEHKEAEERLRTSEAKFRALHESLNDAYASVAMDGRILECNTAYEELVGYPAEELCTKTYFDLTPEKWHAFEERIVVEQVLLNGHSQVYEKEYRRKDGSLVPIELRTTLLRDAAGEPQSMWAIIRDISERKRIEEDLHRVNENLTLALRASKAGVWDWDIATGTIHWSPELFELFALDPRSAVASLELWESVLHPDDRDIARLRVELALQERRDLSSEYRVLLADGQVRWITALGQGIYDEQRQPVRMTGICLDITERKVIEEKLRYSEERFSKAFQNGPSLMTITDFASGRFIDVNDAFIQVSGYSREEAIGRTADELGWARREDLQYVYQQLKEQGRVAGWEVRVTGKGGQSIWCQYFGEVIATSSGEMLMSIAQDISERKRVQEALLLKNLVFDQSLAANSVSDRDGVLTEVNKAFLKCWGYESKEEVVGKPIPHFLADPAKAEEIVAALVRSGQWEGDYSARRKDGSLFVAHGLATVVRDENGEIVGFQSSVLDITERKRTEALLAEAKEAAESANRAKSEFLANMSHEIRTPINGIMGMAQLLEYTRLSNDQREYLDAIRNSSDSLLALVNDVLDLSKIEAGMLELERREFSLRGCVSDVVKSQISLIHAKGLAIRVEIPATVPDNLTGDPLRLKQILLNLVGNAVKFTERGGITLAVGVEARQDDSAQFRFAVADTGIGIKPEVIERIFAPFSQADASTTREFGGSGLGLSICTRLAALMGGTIGVESREGAGSTFHVRIPFAVNDVQLEHSLPRPVAQPPLWEGRSLRVLLAEDNDAGQKFFTEVLRKYGHRVDLALNGAEALQKWPQADYDLILMDVQMPVMDGVEATVRIRRLELEKGGHVPIIALTAHAMEDDRPKLLAQGFDGYVAKPTKIRELLREMKRCLHGEH